MKEGKRCQENCQGCRVTCLLSQRFSGKGLGVPGSEGKKEGGEREREREKGEDRIYDVNELEHVGPNPIFELT